MKLYYHPVSPYAQKALVGLREKGATFTPEIVQLMDPVGRAAFKLINPYGKVPTLVLDDGTVITESTILLDYVDTHVVGGTQLVPEGREAAREVRALDRKFDLYVIEPMSVIFFDSRKPEAARNAAAVTEARATLAISYGLFDELLAGRTWAAGETFSLADCAAAPALAYASMVQPFPERKNLTAYLGRLRERPSFARVLAEAAPFLARMAG